MLVSIAFMEGKQTDVFYKFFQLTLVFFILFGPVLNPDAAPIKLANDFITHGDVIHGGDVINGVDTSSGTLWVT